MLLHSSSFLRFRAGNTPQPWPCLTEFCGPETTGGRGTLMTLVVAAVCPDDPSLQLPLDYQVSEVASLKFSSHCTPRQNTDKCKKDTKSLPSLFGPHTQTLVPVSKGGPGGWETLKSVKVVVSRLKQLVVGHKAEVKPHHLSAPYFPYTPTQ